MRRVDSFEKSLMLGGIGGRRRRVDKSAGSDAFVAASNRAESLTCNWLRPPGWHNKVNKFHRC